MPLDYDSFVLLMTHRTIELDPEDVLLEAWAKWDLDEEGFIDEKKWVFLRDLALYIYILWFYRLEMKELVVTLSELGSL